MQNKHTTLSWKLNKIKNEFDILGIDISENNKEFKSHGLGKPWAKKAHFEAK